MKTWKSWHLAILSGVLIGISYIPFPPISLVFCLVPLLMAWEKSNSPKEMFWCGWIAQFLLSLIGFHWVAHTAQEFGHLPTYLSVLVLLGFCCFNALHFAIAGYLIGKFRLFKSSFIHQSVIISLVIFLCEYLYPMIFPWNMGYPWLYSGFQLFKLASVIGFEGLSFFTIFFNILIFQCIQNLKNLPVFLRTQKNNPILYVLTLVIFAQIFSQTQVEESKHLKVLLVQANIGNFQKAQAERGNQYRFSIIDKYLHLTKEHLKKDSEVDLIVWPETAMPAYLDPGKPASPYLKYIQQQIKNIGIPVFTGIYSSEGKKVFNGVSLFSAQGDSLDHYFKSILLAFGEYFPGTQYIPALKNLVEKYVPAISHFGRGNGPKVIQFFDTKIGPQICYEGLYPDFSRQLAKLEADIFINLTNDSWFGDGFEPYQHLYMTLARAVEFQRPLVRATNTGYSAMILPNGKIHEISPLRTEWTHKYSIPIAHTPKASIYQSVGKFFPLLILLISLLLQYYATKQ